MPSTVYLSGILFMLFVISAVTRALPFAFAKQLANSPKIKRLGTQLPACIMLALLVHTLEETSLFTYPYGIPETFCVAIVVCAHLWQRNAALSIAAGTLPYVLIQTFLM